MAEMWEYSGLRAVGREGITYNKHKKACMRLFKSYLLCEMLYIYIALTVPVKKNAPYFQLLV